MSNSLLETPDILTPGYTPEEIVDREDTLNELTSRISPPGSNIHIYGPRGIGKTLITRKAATESSAKTCYLSGIQYDSQYKVLARLAEVLTGDDVSSGYHTARLQDAVAESISDQELVLILDDVSFLLANDGNDLLYFLSRLDHDALSIVTIGSTQLDLSTAVDERTYSTLHPEHLYIEPYSIQETSTILENRARKAFTQRLSLPEDAVSAIASDTGNLSFGLAWLYEAASAASGTLTEDLVQETRPAAVQRYRDQLLDDFSPHHRLLCDAIDDLTDDASPAAHTGDIYGRYRRLCRMKGRNPLTARRVSDFLKDLERLGIIQADYHYGGKEGKTREIHLQQV